MKTLDEQVLDFVGLTGQALEASQKLAAAKVAEHSKIASIVPKQVSQLVDANLIAGEKRAEAVEKLSSHEGALSVIGKLVEVIQKQASDYAKQIAVLGAGKPEKQAGSEKQGSNTPGVRVLGARENVSANESWRVSERLLGIG